MVKTLKYYVRASQAASVITVVIAAAFLLTILFNIARPSESFELNPFTSVLFFIMGLSFLYTIGKTPAKYKRAVSLIPLIVTFLSLLYACLLPGEQLYNVGSTTLICIVLISAAVFFKQLDQRVYFSFAQVFIVLTLCISFISFIGDLYKSDIFIRENSILMMDFSTSLMFFLFAVSLFLSSPDKGIMGVYLSSSPNGIVLRNLSLILIIIPVVAGWLGLQYEDAGIYTKETGDTIFIFLFVMTPLVLVWRNFHHLYNSDKELKKSRELVFDNEMKFRAIIENTTDAIFIKDLSNRYIMANPATGISFGLKPEDILGKTDIELFGEEKGKKIIEIDKEVLIDNVTVTYDSPSKIENVTAYFLTTKFPYVSQDGSTIGVIGISRDITEKKKNENELLMLSLIARYSTNSVMVLDKDLCIEWVNEGFTKKTLYSFDEAIGKNPKELLEGPLTPEEAKKGIQEGLSSHDTFTQETITYRKDGTCYNSSVEITPIKNSEGDAERYAVVETDITEKVKAKNAIISAKEAAERTAKAKEEFLANMSHEIRTPMNAIIGFTDLLIKSTVTVTKEEQGYLELIKTSGENLLTILNDILDFSKLEANKLTIVKKEISVQKVLETTSQLLSIEAAKKNIRLTVNADKKIPARLMGDPTRLNQVLLNIISNAIKFTPAGSIEMSAKLIKFVGNSAQVKFSVKDTGIGIAPDKLNTIFESFSQASSDTSRMYGGTGLGLAIVKRLLELMGGYIYVKSKPGIGSEFSFDLVFEFPEEETVRASESLNKKINGYERKLKILIVEDNAINIILIKKIMSTFGFDSEVAENGKIAVQKILNNKYDLALMDIQMPVMDGLTATKIIREKHSIMLPIIAITASMLTSDKDKCFEVGMNDFVTKPFNSDELYRKILKCVSGKTEEIPV